MVEELVYAIAKAGGVLALRGDKVEYRLPAAAAHLASELRQRKPELVALLKARGGRIAAFPHCPRCASYYLYRENNIGPYECQTCGLEGIDEATARRLV